MKKQLNEESDSCPENQECMTVSTTISTKCTGQAGLKVSETTSDSENEVTLCIRNSSGNVKVKLSNETAQLLSAEIDEILK